MPDKILLNFKARFWNAKYDRDSRTMFYMMLILFVISAALVYLSFSRSASMEDNIIGRAIANVTKEAQNPPDIKSLSNRQLYKQGYPLKCGRLTGSGDVVVRISGDVAKLTITKSNVIRAEYYITRNAVYAYDSTRNGWRQYPPEYPIALNENPVGNIAAIDFLASTLNLYNCYIRNFDNETVFLQNVI